ncbi:MAG: hypothetical protein ABSG26_05775 [Bryobacteraceae bacterium]|jgi:hypothetical protein
MKIDVEKIDEKIRMLEAIKQIASNPDMAALLEGVIVDRAPAPGRTPPKSTKSGKQQFVRGALKEAVLEAIRKQAKPFSAYELTDGMLADGVYQFTASNPPIAVNDVLRSLVRKKQEVRLYQKGKGGTPHTYAYVKPQISADGATGKGSGD